MPVNGPIRLWRNGNTASTHTSGQVQLVYNGRWGNICGANNFGSTEATVICHQLGYTGASSWGLGSKMWVFCIRFVQVTVCCCIHSFGIDSSPAVISSVNCSTSEYLVILQCSYDNTPPSSCTDSTDVSVQCCEWYIIMLFFKPAWFTIWHWSCKHCECCERHGNKYFLLFRFYIDVKFFDSLISWMLSNTGDAILE